MSIESMADVTTRSTTRGLTMQPMHQRLICALSALALLAAFAQLIGATPSAHAANAPAPKQKTFASAQEGMEAIAAAIAAGDLATLRAILGPESDAVLKSGDAIEDKESLARFDRAYKEGHKLDERPAGTAWIVVGKDAWPMPIPIVKKGEIWSFDTKAGKEELLNRRIGRNELWTMESVLAYVDAQQEYYQRNPQGDKLLQFAQRFVSSQGKRDGLYFPTKAGEKPSPLGPLFEARQAAGVQQGAAPAPYHGYYFRILKGQGAKAPGGAYSYVVNGKMLGGFALVAWPATYENSGVMTFIVNHDGKIYEKDLGPQTAEIAQKMTQFNPDETWARR